MNKPEFQKKLDQLWMTTDGELTALVIAKRVGVGAAELKALLKELISEGAITTDRNADDKLIFIVPKRPRAAQVKKLRALKAAKAATANKGPTPEQKKAEAAGRKRRTKEAAESLEDQPLTAAELDKLAMLTASVAVEVDAKRKQDEEREANQAKLRAAQEAKQAQLDAAKAEKAQAEKPAKPGKLDKMDMALALYDAMDSKPVAKPEDEAKPKKRGWLRRRFGAREALEVASQAKKQLDQPKEPGEKSILFSGVISLLLGPLGWNYAGSFREALPASFVWLGAAALVKSMSLFSFVLMPAFFAGMMVSGIVGMVYAWQFNKKGKRIRLLGDGSDKKKQD